MRVVIVTAGSRGDVQPLVALGKGLAAAGNEVVVATHGNFRRLVEGEGLGFGELGADPQALLRSELGQAWLSTANPLSLVRTMRDICRPLLAECIRNALAICRGADLVVSASLGALITPWVAAELGIRHIQVHLQPVHPTAAFGSIYFPAMPPLPLMQRAYNIGSAKLALAVAWRLFRQPIFDAMRQVFGRVVCTRSLADLLRSDPLVLYAYSPHLIPKPADWGPSVVVTGYWFLDRCDSWAPDDSLQRFLDQGSPPYAIGFGSMIDGRAEQTLETVVSALGRRDLRAVYLSGWSELSTTSDVPDNVKVIESAPHDWLFPRVAGAIHHGGAGTTAASLRAGIPTGVVSFFDDQPFWGNLIHRRGLGPRRISHKKLGPDTLAGLLASMESTPGFRHEAAAMSQRIKAEDGVGAAVAAIMRVRA